MDTLLGLMVWLRNKVTSEEGVVNNSLLLTILIVLGILALGLWLWFNFAISQK